MTGRMSPLYTEKSLEGWKKTLWAMWEEGFKLNPRQIDLGALRVMFMTGFDAGRSSFLVIPDQKPSRKPSRKPKKK